MWVASQNIQIPVRTRNRTPHLRPPLTPECAQFTRRLRSLVPLIDCRGHLGAHTTLQRICCGPRRREMTIGIWKSGCAFLAPTRRGSSSSPSSSQIQDLKARIFLRVRSGGIGFFYPLFAIPSSLNMPAGAPASGGGNRFCSSVAVHAFSDAQEWTGLQAWRTGSLNEFRSWGPEGPMVDKCELAMQDSYCGGESDREHDRRLHCEEAINRVSSIPDALGQQSSIDGSILAFHRQKLSSLEMVRERNLDGKGASSLAEWGALVLGTPDPVDKAFLTHHAFRLWVDGSLPLGVSQAPDSPARPAKPELVSYRTILFMISHCNWTSEHACRSLTLILWNNLCQNWTWNYAPFENASIPCLNSKYFVWHWHAGTSQESATAKGHRPISKCSCSSQSGPYWAKCHWSCLGYSG